MSRAFGCNFGKSLTDATQQREETKCLPPGTVVQHTFVIFVLETILAEILELTYDMVGDLADLVDQVFGG